MSRFSLNAMICGVLLAGGGHAGTTVQEKANMLDYAVTPQSSEFLSGQEVKLRVTFVNRGATPVQIPDPSLATSTQPVHTLVGPRWPDGVRLTNKRVIREGGEVAGADEKLVTIEPGKSWEGIVVVNSFLSLAAEGEYRVRSQFNFQGVKAESKDTTFRIRALKPGSIHLGLGTRPLEMAEGEGAFLDGGAVYSFVIRETRPGIGEAKLDRPVRRAAAGPDATDIGVPWRNSPFFNELLKWLVWREGRSLKGLSSTMTTPVSVELPGEIAHLVRPPLKRTGGLVEVLAVSKDQGTLHLATVGAELGQAAHGSVAWSIPMPAKAGAIAAALGPESGASERHIAFVAAHGKGFTVYHSRYKEGGRPDAFQSVAVDAGRVLDGSTVGVSVDAAGGATVGVVSIGEDGRGCAYVEVVFGADGKAGAPKVVQLGEAVEGVVNTAVLLPGGGKAPVVVVQVKDGRVFTMRDGKLAAAATQGVATAPILLAPGKQTTYILYVDAGRGLYLEGL